MGVKEDQIKRHKITDAEYSSFPGYITAYHKSNLDIPEDWLTDWRKKNPAQPTRADSTFRQLTDKYGVPTGGKIGFNINEPVDRRALRTFEKQESAKLGTKEKPPKTVEEAYQRKITGFTKDIGKLSETAKRLEELNIEAQPITQQIEALSDSIRIESKKFKIHKGGEAKKELLTGTKKLTSDEKSGMATLRNVINASLRAGVGLDTVRERLQTEWGWTLEEFNTIYKNNQ